jgi:hypothetical protein
MDFVCFNYEKLLVWGSFLSGLDSFQSDKG